MYLEDLNPVIAIARILPLLLVLLSNRIQEQPPLRNLEITGQVEELSTIVSILIRTSKFIGIVASRPYPLQDERRTIIV
jgi:hypothetical protein